MSLVGFEPNASDSWPNYWPMGQYHSRPKASGKIRVLYISLCNIWWVITSGVWENKERGFGYLLECMIRVWSKIVKKLRLIPLLNFFFFFQSQFFPQLYVQWSSNQAKNDNNHIYSPGRIYMAIRLCEYIYGYSPGRIYMVIRPGECIYGYSPGANIYMVNRPGEYI